ncbi:hypothetical protein [Winogradskyella sediminis]|uniref:hypothetical protein n=1 Tax=Winogradskyella sediminis TaxID=1382466 RepID=UPI000E242FD2|nr:hypothetical protein [Winogradskyella sediminis]REG89098.1 hypothetical protein C8N41_101336 [Winogradskyella sediminis]
MKPRFLFLAIVCCLSCNEKEKQLEKKLFQLELKNQILIFQLDSLQNISAIKFEALLSEDVLADSLRRSHVNDYIPYYKLNQIRAEDSLLIEKYITFAKENQVSYLSTYALDRIQDIKFKRSQIKINGIVGSWQWEGITNLMFPYKGNKNERIEFRKDGTVLFYTNDKLVAEDTFKIQYPSSYPVGNYITFSKLGTYAMSLKKNNRLTLTKGRGICIDCGTNIYKKH